LTTNRFQIFFLTHCSLRYAQPGFLQMEDLYLAAVPA